MYIKQIIVDGFKSFRDRAVPDAFHKEYNVIVGCNGAGKSNLLDAIQFVLQDEYAFLKPQQRWQVIHASNKPRLEPSFVELIFDNSDRRIPISTDEVAIRRVFDENKDEYLVNKQLTPRAQVMAILQSAGFVPHNPYYIIPQGKITEFSMASNAYRLKYVQEIAGMKVYEQKLSKCLSNQRMIKVKLSQIKEHIVQLQERLGVLVLEKEEFLQYDEQEKIRRTLEHIIFETDIRDTKRKLKNLNKEWDISSNKQRILSNHLRKAEDKIAANTNNIKKSKMELISLKVERDIYHNSYQEFIREEEKLKLNMQDLEKEMRIDSNSVNKAQKELIFFNDAIHKKEVELGMIIPEYKVVKHEEINCNNNLVVKEQRLKELYAKYDRHNHFSSKKTRNSWIAKELSFIDRQIENRFNHENLLEKDIGKDLNKKMDLREKIEHCVKEMVNEHIKENSYATDLLKFNKDKDGYLSTRNELWRKENKDQEENLSILKDEFASVQYKMKSLPGRQLLIGSDSIHQVLHAFKNRGGSDAKILEDYHGTLMDNLKCKKELYTAVEVAVGRKLLYHIVNSDETANRILMEMNRQGLKGEVNFLPLNRLTVKNYVHPETKDAIPMINQLDFEGFVDKAFRYVFGKTLLCRNLDIATKMGRIGYDCITLEGDKVACTGILTGGYTDRSKLHLEVKQRYDDLSSQIMEVEQRMADIRKELKKTDSAINTLAVKTHKTDVKIIESQRAYEKYKRQLKFARDELASIEILLSAKEKSLIQSRLDTKIMKIRQSSLQAEVKENFSSGLSTADEMEVNSLKEEIRHLRKEHEKIFNRRIALEEERDKLETALSNIVRKKRDEALGVLQEALFETHESQFNNAKTKWKTIKSTICDSKAGLSKMDDRILTCEKNLEKLETHLSSWQDKEEEVKGEIYEYAQILDKFVNKQSLLQNNIAKITKSIKELGTVPSLELYNRYSKISHQSILMHLEDVNKQIKRFNHINKKSLEMAEELATNLEDSDTRQKELIVNLKDVAKMLTSLKAYKIDAMFRTFKLVSKYFSENFKRLVPEGRATLLMLTVDNKCYEVLAQDADIDNLIGIGVKASFVESQCELKDIVQLSGGEKSIVSLALIFAFQKCSSAPFYLFDEIDQYFDKHYRKIVAEMILEISKHTQCITITFAREMIECAHKFYGVNYTNNMSTYIKSITQEYAILTSQNKF